MPMYGTNPGLDYQKAQQEKYGDPWKVDFGPRMPKIPHDATAAEMREMVNAHKVAEFVNAHLGDKEISELLPEDEHSFALTVEDFEVTGKQNSRGWSCKAFNQSNEEVKFRLPPSLDKEQAEMAAAQAIRERFGTNPEDELMDVPDSTIDMLQRLALSNPEYAIALYITNRLPADVAEEFSAAYDNRVQNSETFISICCDPLVSLANHEAIFHVFKWRTPQLTEAIEPSFVAYVQANRGSRALSISFLEYLFSEFQRQGTPAVAPTDEELRNLRDDEVRDLYLKTRALASQTQPRSVGVFK